LDLRASTILVGNREEGGSTTLVGDQHSNSLDNGMPRISCNAAKIGSYEKIAVSIWINLMNGRFRFLSLRSALVVLASPSN
jgi:hypothetical protein